MGDYDGLTDTQLADRLCDNGLSKSGNRAEKMARLERHMEGAKDKLRKEAEATFAERRRKTQGRQTPWLDRVGSWLVWFALCFAMWLLLGQACKLMARVYPEWRYPLLVIRCFVGVVGTMACIGCKVWYHSVLQEKYCHAFACSGALYARLLRCGDSLVQVLKEPQLHEPVPRDIPRGAGPEVERTPNNTLHSCSAYVPLVEENCGLDAIPHSHGSLVCAVEAPTVVEANEQGLERTGEESAESHSSSIHGQTPSECELVAASPQSSTDDEGMHPAAAEGERTVASLTQQLNSNDQKLIRTQKSLEDANQALADADLRLLSTTQQLAKAEQTLAESVEELKRTRQLLGEAELAHNTTRQALTDKTHELNATKQHLDDGKRSLKLLTEEYNSLAEDFFSRLDRPCVMVRISGAPMQMERGPHSIITTGNRSALQLAHPSRASAQNKYQFYRVFGDTCSNPDISKPILPILRACQHGVEVCVVADGRSGTGKSHTMLEGQGAVGPTVARDLFSRIQSLNEDGWTCAVQCSALEFHAHGTTDLLSRASAPKGNKRISYVGADQAPPHAKFIDFESAKVPSAASLIQTLQQAYKARKVEKTANNPTSSRGHFFFMIELSYCNPISRETITSRVYLVDLAGNEEMQGRGEESKYINTSRHSLKEVMRRLYTKPGDSVAQGKEFTKAFGNFVHAPKKALVWVTHVGQRPEHYGATLNALDFADELQHPSGNFLG